jgi:hypothetical protein
METADIDSVMKTMNGFFQAYYPRVYRLNEEATMVTIVGISISLKQHICWFAQTCKFIPLGIHLKYIALLGYIHGIDTTPKDGFKTLLAHVHVISL